METRKAEKNQALQATDGWQKKRTAGSRPFLLLFCAVACLFYVGSPAADPSGARFFGSGPP